VIITSYERADQLIANISTRFNQEVLTHYNFIDRQQGFVQLKQSNGEVQKAPLMKMAIGVVSPETHTFSDIREITELAAEERRKQAL